ncbi:MAG: dihydrolipoyl dehydrogenase [Burkholderiaceae bacterium]|nr:dihydrolipoyl dehydrogenase [Burkholderiaceae bacterium]
MAQRYDVIVIGAGPAGYIAAIRAAQLGFKVACVEKWRNPDGKMALGGTCLNVGCIPSKALLASSEQFENASRHLHEHGIVAKGVAVDVAKMVARKDAIVQKMAKGIEFLFRKNKIDWLKGHGRFAGSADGFHRIEVSDGGEVDLNEARNVILATGSKARHLEGVTVDNALVCDNEGALAFDSVPKRLGVIGAGVIGLELGSVWRRLGSQVTILEAMPEFLAACDESVSKACWTIFTEQGLDIRMGVAIGRIKPAKKGVAVEYKDADGKAHKLAFDRLIVSVGRVPNTDDLGLEKVGLSIDARGFIEVDDLCRTGVPGIFAIGDVVRGPMLAHKGEDEGVMVAELIAGQKPHIDYNTIPWVIYTAPEIAWVGKTEGQLKAEKRAYRAGQFPFAVNGRALGTGETDGFVKMLVDSQTDEILGVHIVASSASDLVTEAVVAMEFKASAEDIARVCHPHPSLSEVVREAALATAKRALNM